MDIDPLFEAGWVIYSHSLIAAAAMLLGAAQFLLKKGTRLHRRVGWIWVVFMALVALSSFAIHEIRLLGPFSPIHLLSLFVLYSLWDGVSRIRKGDVAGHRKSMIALYIYAIVITGALTLWPGRLMHTVVFGANGL